jgi:limonene-1,2-epoxide hydrolase
MVARRPRPYAIPTMAQDSAASPIEVVESFLRALERKDVETALALLSDDVVYQNVPLPADRGKAAVARTLKSFERFVTGFEVQMKNIAANGNVVLTERVDILRGPFLYLDIWVCGTFELRDGKITLWRDYFDTAAVTGKLLASPFRKLFERAS